MALTPLRVLVLGGTGEGEAVARLLRDRHGIDPLLIRPPGLGPASPDVPALTLVIESRADLSNLMRGMAAVVVAAHPFSGAFAVAAAEVAAGLGLPVVRLLREPWRPGPLDLWTAVADPKAAAAELMRAGWMRPFVSLGRDELAPFLALRGRELFLRLPGPGALPAIRRGKILTDAGPFSVATEAGLFARHAIDVVVARNTGGKAGWPKLQAARAMRLPVILLRRPPAPPCPLAVTAEAAADWAAAALGLDLVAGGA